MEKKLYKSRTDRKLAGVCGGLAEYFGIDSLLVRIIFFGLAWFAGCGVLLYLLLWILLPIKPRKEWK